MKQILYALAVGMLFFLFNCENENIEEKFPSKNHENPDTNTSSLFEGEIAWFPFNGNLNDSSGNETPLTIVGNEKYVAGLNEENKNGLYLNGSSVLLIKLGFYDTLAIAFWVKGAGEIPGNKKPVLFDYGQNSVSAYLDGSSGATVLHGNKKLNSFSSEDSDLQALNSFNKYSFIYFEAGGEQTKIYFKGYYSDDSELIYSKTYAFPGIIDPVSEILYIGRTSLRPELENSFFTGSIDDIHIFNKPLTQKQIEMLASRNTQ